MAAALLFLNNLGIGGSERKIVRIANALRQAGHDIHLAYLNAPHTLRGHFDSDTPVVHLDRRGKFSFAALRRLERYALESRISHIACVNLYPLLYAQAMAWRLGKHAPVVSVMINTTDFPTSRDERQMIVYTPLLRRATCLVFGCRLQRERWNQRYGLPIANGRVIYNGVDEANFNVAAVADTPEQLRRKYGFPHDAFIAVTVGQMRPEKQQTDLIQAVAALASRTPPIHALLVGEGGERRTIERCVADLGVQDRVHLAGATQDVRPFLKLADAFVLTSTAVETFSNAALEAMAMELPVILSKVGGAAEMIEAGTNGFLYSPGNVTELASHIAVLAGDDGLRRKMGQAAANHVRNRFGFTRMLNEYRALLFPSENHSTPGVQAGCACANPQPTAPVVD